MKQSVRIKLSSILFFSAIISINSVAWPSEPKKNFFLLKTTTKSIAEVVIATKTFAKTRKWVYLGDYKVKKGEVILVKFCVKAAGKIAWKAGLKVSAMLPCGNMGVYKNKKGKTEISLLNPTYMNALYPNPNMVKAAEILAPMYEELMTSITEK